MGYRYRRGLGANRACLCDTFIYRITVPFTTFYGVCMEEHTCCVKLRDTTKHVGQGEVLGDKGTTVV